MGTRILNHHTACKQSEAGTKGDPCWRVSEKCGLMSVSGKPSVGSRSYHDLVEFAVFAARKCIVNASLWCEYRVCDGACCDVQDAIAELRIQSEVTLD